MYTRVSIFRSILQVKQTAPTSLITSLQLYNKRGSSREPVCTKRVLAAGEARKAERLGVDAGRWAVLVARELQAGAGRERAVVRGVVGRRQVRLGRADAARVLKRGGDQATDDPCAQQRRELVPERRVHVRAKRRLLRALLWLPSMHITILNSSWTQKSTRYNW